ncbi:MAG: hypothetical protein WCO93_04945 [bacterium]
MKKILITAIIFLSASGLLLAQDTTHIKKSGDDEVKTLFSKGGTPCKIKLGWYVGPTIAWTQFGGKNAVMPGIEGGLILNHYFSIGLAGSITANMNNLYFTNVRDTMGANFVGGYAGVKMEFTFFPKFPVHFSIPVFIGGGASAYLHQYEYDYASNNYNYDYNYNGHNNYWDCEVLDYNSFFVLEPGLRVEVNLLKFMRLWVGGTYRWAPGYHLMNTPDGFMSNFNFNAGLKFGKF